MDAACSAYDDNVLGFISWEQCTSRSQELSGIRRDPNLRIDLISQGPLKVTPGPTPLFANLASDLRVKDALTRRGLAYDQAMIISYPIHEAWVAKLIRHLDMPPPHGFSETSLEQLRRADARLFQLMGEKTRGGIKVSATGLLPCDAIMTAMMQDPEVVFLLLPMPSRVSKPMAPQGPNSPASAPYSREDTRGQGKKGEKGKGKGKKGKNSGKTDLTELKGLATRTADHHPICFAFNMGGCYNNVSQNRCSRGVHVCMKCFDKHCQRTCPKG